MKKKLSFLCAALILALALAACSNNSGGSSSSAPPAPPANSAGSSSAFEDSSNQQGEIEDWRAEQKIVANGNIYQFLARALFSEEGDPLTARLDSDVQLTDTAVILGTSDYGGMCGGQEMTIPSHNIVIDLNGHTLAAEKGCAVFEVQDGYTLTVVDNSAGKGGKLVADGEAVIVEDGGIYAPLSD